MRSSCLSCATRAFTCLGITVLLRLSHFPLYILSPLRNAALERCSETSSHETNVTVRETALDQRADSDRGSILVNTALTLLEGVRGQEGERSSCCRNPHLSDRGEALAHSTPGLLCTGVALPAFSHVRAPAV